MADKMAFALRDFLRHMDATMWRMFMGPADYMSLHPPFSLRKRIARKLPFHMISGRRCHECPIFVLGAPRSGTTVLFALLRESESLLSYGQESHWVWERFQSPWNTAQHTQVLRARDLSSFSKRYILGCYSSAFGSQRFVDKNPTHSLRIAAIQHLFPGAHFVFIKRNGLDNVASLIDCWQDTSAFRGFDVPLGLNIGGHASQKWKMLLQPNWQSVVALPLEEVCAHQWSEVNKYALNSKSLVVGKHWHEVRYEDLVAKPVTTIRALCGRIDLPFCDRISAFAHNLSENVVNTTSRPGVGKWAERHRESIMSIMPIIEPMMKRMNYQTSQFVDGVEKLGGPQPRDAKAALSSL